MNNRDDGMADWALRAQDRYCEIHQDLDFPGTCDDCINLAVEKAESVARAEGYTDGLREGQERMRERCKTAVGALLNMIHALEVEDGEG